MQAGAEPAAEPRLVVPEGLVIDESARARLARRLALAPETVGGVGAAASELAPGASYRVHAEWTALDVPESAALAFAGGPLRGAVLVRPGVGFAVRDGEVALATGALGIDPGAHTHDPHRPIGPLQVASERGRAPFPRRPLVVFLGIDTPADDWLGRFVNRLLRRDVEARIAAPEVAPGLQLTRPCRPEEASIRALGPDVVVTMDSAAAARVDDWCAGDRATVVVAWDPDLRDPIELVSWQLGRASGRLRARIGPHVEAPAFASLVGRLCAGPQPMPPVERDGPVVRATVREQWTSRAPGDESRTHCVILTGAADEAGSARAAGFADSFDAAGMRVLVAPLDVAGDTARDAPLVLLVGAMSSTDLDALVAARAAAGRPTVFDVSADAVELTEHGPRLTAAAAGLAEACGAATAPGGARHDAARTAAARTLLLPTVVTRARLTALREAREQATPGTPLVVGWRVDATPPAYVDAVAQGVGAYLVDHGVRVEVVGDRGAVPASLLEGPRVTVVHPDDLDPAALARWSLHVWTPALLGEALLDDARLLEEASSAGVATVMPAAALTGVDGVVSPHVLVESEHRADGWLNALHHLLDDDETRARRSQEAVRRADALNGLAVARAMITRLRGWAGYQGAGGSKPHE
jgi:hypothetical protein